MFTPSTHDVRNFFFNTYHNAINQIQLDALQILALKIIKEHPEYDKILSNKAKYLEYSWEQDQAIENPFLHLSLHLAIEEQIKINAPQGISILFEQLCNKLNNRHEAIHYIMAALKATLEQAQKYNIPLDQALYLEKIKRLL